MMSAPRPYCADCARKHLAQAIVLLQEARQGYPSHIWLAIGHMAEAEAEIEGLYRDIATTIRECRKQVEVNPADTPDLMGVIQKISARLSGGDQSAGCDGGCSLMSASEIADMEKRIAERVATKTMRIVEHAHTHR
jgi:hypothetical protein